VASFDDLVHVSVIAACQEWGYHAPESPWHEELNQRLPSGLRLLFERGLDSGLLRMVDDHHFTMRDLSEGKGPYALYSRSPKRVPAPNWEYIVQAVDYVRVHESLTPKGYLIGVEDKLMDITVRSLAGELLWYIESKEKSTDLTKLVRDIQGWGTRGLDFTIKDRNNDGLRKAKYLILNRPPYFSGSAIGIRLDFAVSYSGADRFELVEDAIPFV
jgi:hypothetical protein